MSRMLRRDPVLVDRLLALMLLVAAQAQIWLTSGQHRAVATVAAAVLCGCVAVRRRFPASAGIVAQATVAIAIAFWTDTQILGSSVAWFCALYALTAWTTPRRFAYGMAFIAATNLAAAIGPGVSLARTVPFTVVTLAVMLLVRSVLGGRERRVRLAERERDLAAREAVVEERARIARELHDAIAHNVSMMVVQAGAERRVLDAKRGSTWEVLETIEQIGRGALTEMRRLVGMLRSESADPLAPQPGLSDLPTLCAQVGDAGLAVRLEIEGERRKLPVGIELSAYRIVQEALTNALKHAGDASATVHVRYGDDSLALEIVDDGGGVRAPVASGGHGLVGMRERVALYGGRFDAGLRPTGGFAVSVLLPVR